MLILLSLLTYFNTYYIEYNIYKDFYYARIVMNLASLCSGGIHCLLSKDKKKNDIYLKLLNDLNNLKEIIINNIENK